MISAGSSSDPWFSATNHSTKSSTHNLSKEMIMKTKLTVAIALLGAVLAAPSVVMAEDTVSDEAIRLTADQTQYNNAVAKRATKLQSVQSKARSAEGTSKRMHDEAFRPGGVGG
jgi:hypothetical protein